MPEIRHLTSCVLYVFLFQNILRRAAEERRCAHRHVHN